MAYQYKKRRKAAKEQIRVVRPEKPKRGEPALEGPLEVHGRLVDSKEEYMLAVALDRAGIDYHYQVPLFGGQGELGGIGVDFVCFIPWAVPVEVFGEYFHRDDNKLKLRLGMLFDWFKQQPVVFWDYEMPDQAAVDALVKDRLG